MTTTRLDKIDLLRERTGLGYADAARLLEEADDDVVAALVKFEEEESQKRSAWTNAGEEALQWVKGIVRQGNVTRVRVRQGGRTVVDLPVTAGVVGAIFAPQLTLAAAAVCLFTRCSVEIQRSDGGVESREFGPRPTDA